MSAAQNFSSSSCLGLPGRRRSELMSGYWSYLESPWAGDRVEKPAHGGPDGHGLRQGAWPPLRRRGTRSPSTPSRLNKRCGRTDLYPAAKWQPDTKQCRCCQEDGTQRVRKQKIFRERKYEEHRRG